MRFFIVRHGETDYNKKGILQGQLDTELNKLGVIQAKNLANRFKDYKFDKIFSSGLQRTINTAKEIVKFHDNEIIVDPRLIERDFGDLGGKTKKEFDWENFKKEFIYKKYPNGESFTDVIQRVKMFIDDLENEGNVLIVSHLGIIKVFLHLLLGRDLEDLVMNTKLKNTCVYIIEKKGDKYIPILENCDKHNY